MFLWRNFHLPFFVLRLDRTVFETSLSKTGWAFLKKHSLRYMRKWGRGSEKRAEEGIPASNTPPPWFTLATQARRNNSVPSHNKTMITDKRL